LFRCGLDIAYYLLNPVKSDIHPLQIAIDLFRGFLSSFRCFFLKGLLSEYCARLGKRRETLGIFNNNLQDLLI